MKYIIDLVKYGTVRSSLVRATKEEAMFVANEWSGRCAMNHAVVSKAERVWYAIYSCGNLDSVVDDQRFDEMESAGVFEKDTMDWILVRDGKFYETLSEAVHAFLKEGEADA